MIVKKKFNESKFIIFKGQCVISENKYKSEILNNPTYGDIFVEIDKFVEQSGDYDHIFLADIEIGEMIEDDIYKIEFFLASIWWKKMFFFLNIRYNKDIEKT